MFRLPVLSAILVAAAATARAAIIPRASCNTGEIRCCNTLTDSKSLSENTFIASLLDGLFGNLQGSIGMDCSPLNIIGAGGDTCQSTPVCCENNNVGGLISIGCVPIVL